MKKKILVGIISAIMLIASIGALNACSDKDPVSSATKKFAAVGEVKEATTTVSIKAGETEAYYSETKYTMKETDVEKESRVRTLSEDPNSDEDYTEESKKETVSKEKALKALHANLTANKDVCDGEITVTSGENGTKVTFRLKDESKDAFLGLDETDGAKVKDVEVNILADEKHVTQYEITYVTTNGNVVKITTEYVY